jgi:TRAP-type C4-dicarboxylate transport system permease small subunit
MASWVLATMAAVAFLDVVLRIAGRPITGAYELTALLMGLLVYATLPLVTAQDDHVRAGIMQMWRTAPKGLALALRELRRILSCLALAYLAWALFQYMLRVGAAGDRAPYIEVPLSWVAGFGALSMVLSALMALWSQRRVGAAA